MYDAVIVGAGPAGSATAIHLARAGLEVALLDGGSSPRRKACGEGMFPAGAAELERLGVLQELRQSGARLREVRFHARGRVATAPLGGESRPALGLSRERLDVSLIEAAGRAGADVGVGTATSLLAGEDGRYAGVGTRDCRLEARAVVAADGLNSRLRRLAGLEPRARGDRYGLSAHVEVPGDAGHAVDVWFEEGFEVYVTPVGSGTVNVAVLTRRSGMGRFAGDVDSAFERLLASHPSLPPGARILDRPLAGGPFPVSCGRSWRRNLVLAGDAAGFFDGITGEGISLALASARECAAAVCSYLEDGNEAAFAAYDRRRRELARPSELLARLSLLLSKRRLTRALAVRNLARRPETFSRLVAVNAGELPLSALRPRDLLALALGV